MKTSDLNQLIRGLSSADSLKRNIDEEVLSYSKLINKRGSSISLVLIEDEDINLDNSAIKRLLQETLSGGLSNIHLAYICDCITMGEKVHFKDQNAEDIVFKIAEPEINGGYKSNVELQKLLEELL